MKKIILVAGLLLCSTWSFAQHSNFLEGKRFYEKTDGGKEYFNFKYGGDFVLESPEVTIGFTNRGIKYTPTGKTNTTNGKYEYDDSLSTLRIYSENSDCSYKVNIIGSKYILTPIEKLNTSIITTCFQKNLRETKY
jgi:hypothetical protein